MSMLGAQMKATTESLNSFQPTLDYLSSTRDVFEMIMESGKPLSGVKYCRLKIVELYGIKIVWFYKVGVGCFLLTMIVWLTDSEAQGQSHEAMKNLANSMGILAGQLNRLKQVPKSNELGVTINGFLGMIEEVVDFIQKWLKNWMYMY